jgi:hypothetical protein
VRSSKGNGRSCLTLKRFRSKAFSSVPAGSVWRLFCNVEVKQGGHNIPEDVIRRRYDAGWRNFQGFYRELADAWVVFDNAGEKPVLIDSGGNYENGKENRT